MGLPSLPRPLLMSASLALAPPVPTSPARGTHCSSARTLRSRRGGCKLAGTHGAQGAEGLGGGDARGRRQLALVRPSLRERRLEEPRAPARRSPAAAAAASLFSSSELRSASGTGPKKIRQSCLPPGERSRSSLCLESQHLQPRLQCVPGEFALGRPA